MLPKIHRTYLNSWSSWFDRCTMNWRVRLLLVIKTDVYWILWFASVLINGLTDFDWIVDFLYFLVVIRLALSYVAIVLSKVGTSIFRCWITTSTDRFIRWIMLCLWVKVLVITCLILLLVFRYHECISFIFGIILSDTTYIWQLVIRWWRILHLRCLFGSWIWSCNW